MMFFNYYTLPIPNVKNIIVPFARTNTILTDYFNKYGKTGARGSKTMELINDKYSRLMNTTRPLIGQLIQQFDMKKAADEQKRTTVSRSGRLDTDRLCLHKITDDIFMNFATVADGKNHGMVMVIDWSSSMAMATEDVLTQVVMLSQFCKRMSIPFDVYLFTSNCSLLCKNKDNSMHEQKLDPQWDTKTGFKTFNKNTANGNYSDDVSTENFCLIHMLSSDMKALEFTNGLKNLFTLGQFITRPRDIVSYTDSRGDLQFTHDCLYVPVGFTQSNTPLDSTIVAMMKIVPEFKEKHKVQIVNTIFLTDGDTGHSVVYVRNYSNEQIYVSCPFNNKEYNISDYPTSTDALLHIFGDVTGSNTIGFFITGKHAYTRYTNPVDRKEEWK